MKTLLVRLENFLEFGGVKKEITLLILSGVALVMSLCGWEPFPFDMAWIAVILCGIPIIMEALSDWLLNLTLRRMCWFRWR